MMSLYKLQMQAQPALQIPPSGLKLDGFGHPRRQREKVVVVMGATGTGKSRLSVDLAKLFPPAEVVNSDKMQVYQDLHVVTNKVTKEEQRGVPHHLLGTVKNPNADFTAADFRGAAREAVDGIVSRRRLPIIVGGSNSFVEQLVDDRDEGRDFRSRYECCFLWVDVSMPVLHSHVSDRVDEMVRNGMVEEARRLFDPSASYARGIRRAIGVPEFDRYFRMEMAAGGSDASARARALREAVREVKDNTCKLACRQLGKIQRLRSRKGWRLHRLDATEVYRQKARGEAAAEQAWQRHVAGPGASIVRQFLCDMAPEFPPTLAGMRVPASMMAALAAAASH